jgi:hypothetical protein
MTVDGWRNKEDRTLSKVNQSEEKLCGTRTRTENLSGGLE